MYKYQIGNDGSVIPVVKGCPVCLTDSEVMILEYIDFQALFWCPNCDFQGEIYYGRPDKWVPQKPGIL